MAALAIIGGVLSLAGAGVGAYSTIQASNAQAKAEEYNAAVAQQNAQIAGQQAEYEAARIRAKNRKVMAAQRTALAKSGVQLSGSATDIMWDSEVQGELDAQARIYSGMLSSVGYQNESQLAKMNARSARRSAPLAAAGTILGGLGGAANSLDTYVSRKKYPSFKMS